MSRKEKLSIINNALYHLGVLLPGEYLAADAYRYVERELDAILSSLHLILAERIALQYKAPTVTSTIATDNATLPRAGDKSD